MTQTPTPGTLLRLATAGSVDDGKSTLVGRLLHDAHAILSDQLAAVTRSSAERGFGAAPAGSDAGDDPDAGPALDLALLTDGLRDEREQGITIDVAYRYFATDRRSFVLADCPGHVQYTRNTVTGASTADAVVLLVDVRHGVVEQTRRHLAVATLLRVEHVIVAVNKIDAVDYREEAFRAAERDILQVARELRGPGRNGSPDGPEPIVVPVSALHGDNVVTTSARTPWYTPQAQGASAYSGQALLPILEQLPDADALARRAEPLRLPVQSVIRAHDGYRGYAGQIAAGTLRAGDRVRIQPGNQLTEVTALERTRLQAQHAADTSTAATSTAGTSGPEPEVAAAGESLTIRLAGDHDVARGSVLTDPQRPAVELDEVTLQVAWLHQRPAVAGSRVLFKHGTATIKALVTEVSDRLDLTTLRSGPADQLQLNDIGTVTLRLASVLPVDDYAVSKRTGAGLLIDPADGNTLAAAMIQLPDPQDADATAPDSDEDWLNS
ncbi:sulfate adenylyltransferase subunit 1 [Nesterenkonia sandarakina]|uniref:sulfate adenylyltransferase n=1 Tax=Nesterenkonia sandarakina TaxID=272918 RepID=A0A2T0YEA4_9MICC|nr:GTP-binding protein [Nesterenkonia sandarakina]PRZ13131.1 sulfate adenylyltransferase subunit 1 [Nesterenkonia sandarakina]